MALLDQVENQVARGGREPASGSTAPEDVTDDATAALGGATVRHREALLSVQRAVDRFSERTDAPLPPNPRDSLEDAIEQIRSAQRRKAAPAIPAAPEAEPEPAPVPEQHEPVAPATEDLPVALPAGPNLDAMAGAVGALTRRLEELETEIRAEAHGQTANVREIADQLGQLSHVVELLAGAVGEAGQVKRLESQIAQLAKLLAEPTPVDLSGIDGRMDEVAQTIATLGELQRAFVARDDRAEIGQRIDDVARTVERLADLQQGHAERVERIGIKDRLDDVSATVGRLADLQVQVANRLEHPKDKVKEGLGRIEEAIRNVYDRIDSVEKAVAMTPAEIEKVTGELARITAALDDPKPAKGLVEMVDALGARLGKVEGRSNELNALKSEIESLRGAVAEALEPRFVALEHQLETLSDRMSRKLTPDPGIAQIEAQVRQLVARMDQTGEQLTGLAKLYGQGAETEPPDFEAIAETVAKRTSEMLAKAAPPQPSTAIDDDGFDEIERRVERVVKAAARNREPSEDFVALRSTIDEVGSRLARLEASLTSHRDTTVEVPAPPAEASEATAEAPPTPEMAAQPAVPLSAPPAPSVSEAAEGAPKKSRKGVVPPEAVAADSHGEPSVRSSLVEDPSDAFAAAIAAAGANAAAGAGRTARDKMPANPADKAPLRDKPFPEPEGAAQRSAASGGRHRHPGLEDEIAEMAKSGQARPAFDPEAVQRPPQPRSSLDAGAQALAGTPTAPRTATTDPAAASSRNTFIEAHRRAARQASARSVEPAPAGNSLIGRALARFQAVAIKSQPIQDVADIAPKPEKPSRPTTKAEAPVVVSEEPPVEVPSEDKGPKLRVGIAKPAKTRKAKAAKEKPAKAKPPKTDDSEAPVEPMAIAAAGEGQESFLLRHRKPILLAAAIVALGCLTINFLSQRLAEGSATPTSSTVTTGEAAMSPTPVAEQKVDLSAAVSPRASDTTDATMTGAIDPSSGSAAQALMPPAAPEPAQAFTSDPPATVQTASLDSGPDASQPMSDLAGPVKVDPPPEGIGPDPLRQAAADGDARAQFEVAAIYTEGRAVPQDLKSAAVWYERAAAQGFAPAQYRLGSLYEHGEGVTKDLSQARLWYERAAEAGNRMAMHNLAALYAGGNLGKQQFDSAAKWFEEAADRGLTDSQFNLGMLYARGLGVTQSLKDSYKWFALAATKGDADAAKARDDIAASLDATTVQQINDEVKAWRPQPVDLVANYAPIGTWAKDFDPGTTITTHDVVLQVQQALEQLGYDVGTPDGIAGPKTAEAIRDFERGTGMSESGAVNPRLLAVLGSQPA